MIKRFSVVLIMLFIAVLSAGCDLSNAIATVTARANGTNTLNAILSPAPTLTPAAPTAIPTSMAAVAPSAAATLSAGTNVTAQATNPPGATPSAPSATAEASVAATGAVTTAPTQTTVPTMMATTAATSAAATQSATLSATQSAITTAATATPLAGVAVRHDTRWFNDTILYSVFVRSFRDSNGDGIGDLQGVIDGLDYIQSLGANTIWLLPVFKSPSYHGYDISDYYTVNPDYGTNDDLIRLIREVHRRHMRILLDYVVNHTSDQHPYFKDALGNPQSQYSEYYTWLNTAHTQYQSFAGVQNMPTLNYDSPKVRQFAINIALHWMDPLGDGDLSAGVDGYRCDVATGPPHEFWAQLRTAMNAKNPQSLLLGELWVPTPKTIASYLQGDQFDAAFDFPLYAAVGGQPEKDGDGGLAGNFAPGIPLSLRVGQKTYPSDAHLVRFVNNHDTNRVLSDVNGDPARARAAAVFELTVPGTPVIYYGEELGMKGDKGGAPWYDAYRREPLPWHAALKGAGQTTWFTPPDANNKPNTGISVDEQDAKPDSLLTLYRTLGTLRTQHDALREGSYDLPTLSGAQRDLYVLRDWNGGELMITVINFGKTAIGLVAGRVVVGGRRGLHAGCGSAAQRGDHGQRRHLDVSTGRLCDFPRAVKLLGNAEGGREMELLRALLIGGTMAGTVVLIGLLISELRSSRAANVPIRLPRFSVPRSMSDVLSAEGDLSRSPFPQITRWIDAFKNAVQNHPIKALGIIESALWLVILISMIDHISSPSSFTASAVWYLIIGWHELGHIICMPFGMFIMMAGGSIWQVLVWALIAAVLLFRRRITQGLLAWAVAGHSLINLSRYIGDARARKLPLLFGLDSTHHDWWYLLSHTGLLNFDSLFAVIAALLGCLILLSAVGGGIASAWFLPRTQIRARRRF